MVDWIARMDMEANGLMYKEVMAKPSKKEYEMPNEEFDEVTYNMRLWQSPSLSFFDAPVESEEAKDGEETKMVADDRITLMNHEVAFTSMDKIKCSAFKKALQSMKRTEKCRFTVSE